MTVLLIETPSPKLRGTLTRWMFEIKPSVFVGNLSATVRNCIWRKVTNTDFDALLIYSFKNEQGFKMEMNNTPKRKIVDFEGLQLIQYSTSITHLNE